MKKVAWILFLLLVFVLRSGAQNFSGVYLTYEDYVSEKLAYPADCSQKAHIRLNETFNGAFITIRNDQNKVKLHKDSVYGVALCGKGLIRFQSKQAFYLIEQGDVWIFYKEEIEHEGKSSRVTRHYYFSKGGKEKLFPLSVNNIKMAFPGKEQFHDLLDDQFRNDDASLYDDFHKMFKINHLLKYSLK